MSQHLSKLASVFPHSEIIAALDEWWETEIEEAELPPEPEAPVSIMQPIVEIDSHRAVRVLITVEEVLGGGHIPESIIQKGGYSDFEEMKADLIPKLEAYYVKKKEKANA